MKIASVDAGQGPTVCLRDNDGSLIDLRHLGGGLPTNLRALLELGPEILAEVQSRCSSVTQRLEEAQVRFLPLVPDPQAVWCAALNYKTHITEGAWEHPDEHPPFFLRLSVSLCGHCEPMIAPVASEKLDYEGELALIIGQRARHVPESAAYDVIAGYSCFNDGSVRDWQRHSRQISPGKNFSQTGPFGPWLTTKDELPDIESAQLTTRLNGKVMQQALIGEMVFDIPRMISYLSTICELLPGDVIVTGTPGGVGTRQDPPVFLMDGDEVEVEVDGVGVLRNPVVKEQWAG